jgi:hypothetical protein
MWYNKYRFTEKREGEMRKNIALLVLSAALILMGIVGCSCTREFSIRDTDILYETKLVEQKPGELVDPDCGVGKLILTLKLCYRLGFVWEKSEDFPWPSGVELEEAINSGRYNLFSVTTFYDRQSGLLRGSMVSYGYCRGEGNKIRCKIMLPTTMEDMTAAEGRMKGELHDLTGDESIEIIKIVKAVLDDRLVGVEVYYRSE